jgi:diguanylate cyclase (GGDEF)-like protein
MPDSLLHSDVLPLAWLERARALAPTAPGVRAELIRYEDAAHAGPSPETYERGLTLVRAVAAAAQDWVRSHPGLLAPGAASADPWPTLIAGVARDALGDTPGAVELLERSLAERHDAPAADLRPDLTLAATHALAVAYTHFGDVTRAARAWHDAAALAHARGDVRQVATFTANLGFLYGEHDEPRPYETYTRRALEMLRVVGDARLVAHGLCNLGGALQRAGRLAEARACYEEGLPLALALDWPNGHALFHAGFGGVLIGEGRVDDGLASYAQSLDILTRLGDTWQHTRHRFILGRHLVEIGRFSEAVAVLEAGLAVARERAYGSIEANSLLYLAQAREGLGQPAAALQALWRHLAARGAVTAAQVSDRVRVAELRLEAESMKREAERKRCRSDELQRLNDQLAEALAAQRALQAQLEALARTDALTGLPNRRHQAALLSSLSGRAGLAVTLLDIDHFKRVNDDHGHAVSDAVLVALAERLQRCLRGTDTVARWGGEEFCVTMPHTAPTAARRLAERLATTVANHPFDTPAGPLTLTISVGIATSSAPGTTPETLLLRADQALYAAKRAGRAQVVVAGDEA